MYTKKENEKRFTSIKEYYLLNKDKETVQSICKKFKMDQGVFSSKMKKLGFDMRRKSNIDDTIFDIIDTEEKAYWLGFLYADGNVYIKDEKFRRVNRVELGLCEKDKNHLIKFIKFLKGDLNMLKYRKTTKSYRVYFSSKYLVNSLIKLGCVPNKSLILKFPNKNQVPEKLILPFIRGYFDGDGCISWPKSQVSSCKIDILGTLEFLKEVSKLCDNVVIRPKDKRTQGNTYTLAFLMPDKIEFIYKMYNNLKPSIFLERKYNKFIQFLYNCRSGKKFLELLEGNIGEG